MKTYSIGRRSKYSSEEERKEAIKQQKTRYMLNKPWYCDICKREYCLAGKWSHLKTAKHINNIVKNKINLTKD